MLSSSSLPESKLQQPSANRLDSVDVNDYLASGGVRPPNEIDDKDCLGAAEQDNKHEIDNDEDTDVAAGHSFPERVDSTIEDSSSDGTAETNSVVVVENAVFGTSKATATTALGITTTTTTSPHNLETTTASASPSFFSGTIAPLKLTLPLPPSTAMMNGEAPPPPSAASATTFAEVIRNRTQQRRKQEDAIVSELTVQVNHLEAALHAETKRRIAAVTSVQKQSREAVAAMEGHLQQVLSSELQQVQDRLQKLEDRVMDLDERWERDASELGQKSIQQAKDFQSELDSLRRSFRAERGNREVREQQLGAQITDVSDQLQTLWTAERQDRMADMSRLQDVIVQSKSMTSTQQLQFEDRVTAELETLKNKLDTEQQHRIAADERIVHEQNMHVKELSSIVGAAATIHY